MIKKKTQLKCHLKINNNDDDGDWQKTPFKKLVKDTTSIKNIAATNMQHTHNFSYIYI